MSGGGGSLSAVPRQIARLNSDCCYQRQVSAAAIYSFFQDPFVRPFIEEKFENEAAVVVELQLVPYGLDYQKSLSVVQELLSPGEMHRSKSVAREIRFVD